MLISRRFMNPTHRHRKAFHALSALVAIGMVVMPVGMPMPPVPGPDTIQADTQSSLAFVVINRFGVLTEDDLEVEHSDFTVIRQSCCEAPVGTTGWFISFLWTERLHRPPIA